MKNFLFAAIVFMSIIAGAIIYLSNRYALFFGLETPVYLYAIFASAILVMILSLINYTKTTAALGSTAIKVGGVAMGFFIVMLLVTLMLDFAFIFMPFSLTLKGEIMLFTAIGLTIFAVWNSYYVRIRERIIVIPELSKSIKALHLTDTHLGHFRGAKTLQKIVNKINKANVDVVFFTGDILDSRVQLKLESMRPLALLNVPVFFVEGNHDHATGVLAIKQYLRQIGVRVLENEVTEWNGIQIIGLNHMAADSKSPNAFVDTLGPTIKSVLSELNIVKNKPSILLHHSPDGVAYANEAGVNLYLAGHTHAGQMFPATIVASSMFAYNKGLHQFKETFINVCQGTGTIGPPMRLGTISEMNILYLNPV